MKCSNSHIIDRLKKKASQSNCRSKVAAIGIDYRGRIIASSCNSCRFDHKGGGLHAEMAVMKKAPKSLRTIIICRVGLGGDLRPINPCARCQEKADELGIKIRTLCE